MKLVIDIPEWLFNTCKSLVECGDASGEDVIIANGTPVKTDKDRPQGEWIPVSDRLPEESLNSVIGWDTYRERCVFVQYIGGHFQIMGKPESFDIVAWMPLPEPYEKGEEE